MIIRILAQQIPSVWEHIKFATSKVNDLVESERGRYFNRLLHALLNDKAQCFVRISDERQLLGLAITQFSQDEVTNDKSLMVECLYSFQGVSQEQWQSDIDFIKKIAKANDCKKINAVSNNQRVFDIVTSIGFKERFRMFTLPLEG